MAKILFISFAQFDTFIEDELIHKQYSSFIEAVLDLLYHEVILCQECGIHMTAEIIKVTLLKNKKMFLLMENVFFTFI